MVIAAAVREQQENRQVEGIIQHLEEVISVTPAPLFSDEEATTSPSPTTVPTPTQRPARVTTPTAPPQEINEATETSEINIEFLNLPTTVQGGESFTVRWRVTGPEGAVNGRTSLNAQYNVQSESDGSSSSVNSSNTQSYGINTLPQTFSTDLTYGSMPGAVVIEIEADVNGKTARQTSSIQIK